VSFASGEAVVGSNDEVFRRWSLLCIVCRTDDMHTRCKFVHQRPTIETGHWFYNWWL